MEISLPCLRSWMINICFNNVVNHNLFKHIYSSFSTGCKIKHFIQLVKTIFFQNHLLKVNEKAFSLNSNCYWNLYYFYVIPRKFLCFSTNNTCNNNFKNNGLINLLYPTKFKIILGELYYYDYYMIIIFFQI